jgi:UDPglucose 6-dehydrogenase/GDP-mannose 6-dehydrogenase
MRIAIVGVGYVGLVTGVCLAAKGHEVTCVDVRAELVKKLNNGEAPILERGLPELLRGGIAAGRFKATGVLHEALAGAQVVLLAVGTPSAGGRIDLTYVSEAVKQIGIWLREQPGFLAVVVKSTVVPGTTDTFLRSVIEAASGKALGAFGLGMNPEFLREGSAVDDFMQPDRIVLGFEDDRTLRLLEELYRPWNCEKLAVNTRTAEFIKYASNCLLATQISAVNEIANLAAAFGGVDAMDVMRGVHLDKRWNPLLPNGSRLSPAILEYLVPGCGFGGSCFPKDVQALCRQGEDTGLPMHLLKAVLGINEAQPSQVAALLRRHFGRLEGRRILVLGLAFKPDTDDVRESSSRRIIRSLLAEGALVSVHDPAAVANARREWKELSNIAYVDDWSDMLGKVDAVVLATAWSEYRRLQSAKLRRDLAGRVVVDARRFFQPGDFPDSTYLAIGYSMAVKTRSESGTQDSGH